MLSASDLVSWFYRFSNSKANERGVSQLRTAVEFGVIGGFEPIQKTNL